MFDNNDKENGFDFDEFMKKKGGVEDRLAFGVCFTIFLNLSLLLNLIINRITGINLWADKKALLVMVIIDFFIASVIEKKLTKYYNRDKNLNRYFYVIGFLLMFIFLGGILSISSLN